MGKGGYAELIEGNSYILKNVVTDEFQGRFSVKLNRTSQIQDLDEDIAVAPRRQSLQARS